MGLGTKRNEVQLSFVPWLPYVFGSSPEAGRSNMSASREKTVLSLSDL
jgi:hypothetical protein